jgi:hypothetical protein
MLQSDRELSAAAGAVDCALRSLIHILAVDGNGCVLSTDRGVERLVLDERRARMVSSVPREITSEGNGVPCLRNGVACATQGLAQLRGCLSVEC